MLKGELKQAVPAGERELFADVGAVRFNRFAVETASPLAEFFRFACGTASCAGA